MAARVIVITGASGGLGQATVRAFLQENNENFIFLGVHRNTAGIQAIQAASPARCASVDLDVTSRSDWERAVEVILAGHGRIDVLVNNAGLARDGLLGTMPDEAWASVLSANLDGTFLGCRAVLPSMVSQRQGRIINVASLSGLLAPPGQANYAAAKAGVIALTQSLAKEVARLGITVNAVCPGYIETEALAGMGEEARQAARNRVPMRRFGRPEEVAAAVRFLATPDASYITGSILKIDGGIF